ncbi:MAG: FAD-dependent oxidoreductase [Chloroflexota bacterium]
MEVQKNLVAVIGAGPAGLFAARYLSNNGVRVALFNRDIKPGGLAEYGIYLDKLKMKKGLRKQFAQILSSPGVDYFGNVKVSSGGRLLLSDLVEMGFQSIVIATGAQGTKWLQLPGENLPGVYHAKNLVFNYNLLPPYSMRRYLIGPKVVLVGAGNVMMDIAHFLTREKKVDEITIVMRRGPGEVKFTRNELENVAANIDLVSLEAEFSRVAPILKTVGQDINIARQFFMDGLPNALEPVSDTKLFFEFLVSPVSILGDWTRGASAINVEENTLVSENGNLKPRGLGTTRKINANTVIFAIGDTVDKEFSLPIIGDAYSVNPHQSFPVDGISYEAFDNYAKVPVKGVFLAGWARQASSGLVGVARKDGENAAKAVLQYLQTLPPIHDLENTYANFTNWLHTNLKHIVTKDDLEQMHAAEQVEIQVRGLEDFKFATNEDMLRIMRL